MCRRELPTQGEQSVRCTRVEFKGFRRLVDTGTGIDGEITAFVGINEAGKTSALNALEWLSRIGPLTSADRSRDLDIADQSVVVRAYFALSNDDGAAISDIPMQAVPTSLVKSKSAGGKISYELQPPVRRAATEFTSAITRLERLRGPISAHLEARSSEETDEPDPEEWVESVMQALQSPDDEWQDEDLVALEWLTELLAQTQFRLKAERVLSKDLSVSLEGIKETVTSLHPRDRVLQALTQRIPRFVMFSEENRVLHSVYNLADENIAEDPPAALRDLLRIASITLPKLWEHVQVGDTTRRETMIDTGNARLLSFFSQAWNQSNITVRLNVNGNNLEVLVKELREDGPVTEIAERSDGLRTFVALAAFLGSGGWKVAPILLIDEAEMHLHFDAQADLVGVLLKSVDAEQVFYTTHSPGCLPSDLGTGIRLVAHDPGNASASKIRNNFWAGTEPGFAPLLFAMGAGAAAFSVCRKAVVAEGPTEMVLLPALLRLATGVDDLEYQIAPGLANARAYGMRVEEVAAKVVYLADGDSGGDRLLKQLEDAEVSPRRLFQLPKGCAVEDLINADDYLSVVNGMLQEMGQSAHFSRSDIKPDTTVALSLTKWASSVGVQLPGKVELAYALLRYPNLRLRPEAKRHLQRLHGQMAQALSPT